MSNLKAFEKLLQGYKTYATALAVALFGILYTGFHTHQWSTFGGAWDYLFSAAGLAAIRAALATHTASVVDALFASSNASTVVPSTPVPTVQNIATNESQTPPTPPLIPVG